MGTRLETIVVGPVMVVACRDDLTALDQDRSEGEHHGTLGGRVGTLRQIELCLIHCGLEHGFCGVC